MFSSAIWWKWPTIQSVLCTTLSKAIVALTIPDRPASSQLSEAEEDGSPGRVPLEVRAVDREPEAVERQRRRDHERERRRLHRGVDRGLRRPVGVVEVHVVRPDEDVRDHGDRPRDRDRVAGDERPPRELRDEVVVDRGRREEQQVHDRVAEPPEDVLREQRVDRDARIPRLDDHLDEQHCERQRRDDHVDRDHRQRDHRVRHRLGFVAKRFGHR